MSFGPRPNLTFLEDAKHMADEAFSSSRSLRGDIEMTINALTIQRLATNEKKTSSLLKHKPFDNVSITKHKVFDNASITSSTIKRKQKLSSMMRKIKKKMHLKTKEKEIEKIRRDTLIKRTTQDSYRTQLQSLADMMADERELSINVILADEETNHNEVLSFQCKMRDNISVKGLMDKIPQYSCDPILRKKKYEFICLDNNFVLDDTELLQSYFLPSKDNQFAIAVPAGRTSVQAVKLALP